MQTLHSLTEIHKLYETGGSRPVEVMCENFETYICKYSLPPADKLFREYIANRFAHIWGLHRPEGACVFIDREHIPLDKIPDHISYEHFRIPCFGTRKHPYAKEVDATFLGKNDYRRALVDVEDYLKIALFDLWLSNEDRNAGNFNLLLDPIEGSEMFRFLLIDHERIFNSGNTDQEIYPISLEDSLIDAPHFDMLFRSSKKLRDSIEILTGNFYIWVEACNNRLTDLLSKVPPTWEIDLAYMKDYLNAHIFRESWLKVTEQHFRTYIQLKLHS